MRKLKRITIVAALMLLVTLQIAPQVSAQTHTGYWTSVEIPQDSAWPVRLTFADSLVGYLQCTFGGHGNSFWYYRTTDGGATWKIMTFGKYGKSHQTVGPKRDTMYAFYPGGHYSIQVASSVVAFARVFEHDSTSVSGERPLLLKTTDRGATWNEVQTSNGYSENWDLVHFFNERYGLRIQKTNLPTKPTGLFYTPNGGGSFFQKALALDFLNDARYAQGPLLIFDSAHWCSFDSLNLATGLSYHYNSTGGWWDWDSGSLTNPSWWKYPRWHGSSVYYPSQSESVQAVPGTPNGFLFTCGDLGFTNAVSFRGFSDTMVTYYATTDFGHSWIPNYSFLERAKGFEGTSANDIWMTVLPKPIPYQYFVLHDTVLTRWPLLSSDSQISASWIVHSTDAGATWDTDRYTLRKLESYEYDGEVIASSDPDHVWIGAVLDNKTTIFKYHPFKNSSVETEAPSSPYRPIDLPFWINIYPNPAELRTTVALARNDPMRNVEVYDLLGRKMDVGIQRISESSLSLDVSKLNAGAYSVLFNDYYGKLAKMFLVRR